MEQGSSYTGLKVIEHVDRYMMVVDGWKEKLHLGFFVCLLDYYLYISEAWFYSCFWTRDI